MALPEKVLIDRDLLLSLLEPLRLAHIYVLKDHPEHRELLTSDFKPWKWDGFEAQFAAQCDEAHHRLLTALKEASGETGWYGS